MTRRRSGFLTLLAAAFLAAAAAVPQAPPVPVPDPNPLMSRSLLPFQAPPFDRIRVADYQPAIEAGMKQQRRRLPPSPPTRRRRPSPTRSRRWSARASC